MDENNFISISTKRFSGLCLCMHRVHDLTLKTKILVFWPCIYNIWCDFFKTWDQIMVLSCFSCDPHCQMSNKILVFWPCILVSSIEFICKSPNLCLGIKDINICSLSKNVTFTPSPYLFNHLCKPFLAFTKGQMLVMSLKPWACCYFWIQPHQN